MYDSLSRKCNFAYITRPEFFDLYSEDLIDPPRVGVSDVAEDAHSVRMRNLIGIDRAGISDQQVINARRAYYGSISYVDQQVGVIMQALGESGFGQNTVVVFTSDHGDMLGERGLWFKMSWFEHSSRVPLVVSFPSDLNAGRSTGAVSLADLLPTMVDLATDGKGIEYQCTMDGRTLLPQLTSSHGHDEAIGQYTAEFATGPIFMVRKGSRKFILGEKDPPMLFDLDNDPGELDNLAADPAYGPSIAKLWDQIHASWDVEGMKTRILESQRRRRSVVPSLVRQGVSWDHEPRIDAARCYIRNNLELYEIERRSRFPSR